MNPLRSRMLRYLAAGAMASVGLVAQTTTGSLTIKVTDAQGRAVAGARVELRSTAMNGSRTGTTDENGLFRAPLLPPGGYTGTVVKDGFKPQGVQAVVPLGGATTVEAPLSTMQEQSAVVEILGTQSKVDKSEVQFKENFLQENVLQLPMGRNLTAITQLAPGVTTGAGGSPVINGAASYENKYLVDGTDINDNYFNSDDGLFIEDAIAETAILQNNVSAEYGRFTGGVINAITKTGTNEFSGSLRAAMTNPAWSATLPGQDRNDDSFKSKIGTTYTVTVGGPILKDKLWFFVAGRFVSRSDQNLTLVGYPFTTKQDQKRYEGNIAWQINNNNRLQGTYIRRTVDVGPSAPLTDYTAGLDSLSNRSDNFSLSSLSWDSVLTDWMNLSVKASEKKHEITSSGALGSGGTAFWQSPVFDLTTGAQFNNHYFSDDPENRDNRNISATLSMYLHGAGEHAFKVGVEHFTEYDDGKNGQSPTGFDINADITYTSDPHGPVTYSFDPATAYLDDWSNAPGGKFTSKYDSAFVNDNWTVDKHLNVSLGLRYERYSGSGPSGYLTPTISSLSPRLGMNLDPVGDGSWQVSLTYAQYAGKASAAITTLATTVGNPTLYDYAYIGPAVSGVVAGPSAIGFRRSDYDTTPFYVADPTLNVKLADNLKTPLTTEYTLGLTHKIGARGDWTLRYISRSYTRMFEDYKGDQGTVNDALGNPLSIIVWGNTTDQNASRTYKALQATYEDTFNLWGGSLSVFGNFTYSWLQGNYEGDGGNSPGGGTQIGDYPGIEPGGVGYGYLANDERQHWKANALWSRDIGINKLTLGFNYDRVSGRPYDIKRNTSTAGISPNPYPDGPNTYTQYYQNQRGAGRFPGSDALNLSAQWDGRITRSSKVGYFAKLTVFNALNHIQEIGYRTKMASAGLPSDPWVQGAKFGQPVYNDPANNYPYNPVYFTGARRFTVDVGFRF